MSVFSYERDTTPTLRELSGPSLVVENAFTNAGATLGSIASIFTSKLPFETGVIYPPNISQGTDASEHLPGILSKAGYKAVEIGVPHYVDAFSILSFDRYVAELVQTLKRNGQFDHTLLIFYSDHAMQNQTNARIPLIFHFPADQFA
jgi:arylsulfatase A-like enzyme